MNIGIAQVCAPVGDFAHAVEDIIAQARRADVMGVDLLVFPRNYLSLTEFVSAEGDALHEVDVLNALSAATHGFECDCLVPQVNAAVARPCVRLLLAGKGRVDTFPLVTDVSYAGFQLHLQDAADGVDAYTGSATAHDVAIAYDDSPFVAGEAALDEFADNVSYFGCWVVRMGSIGEKDGLIMPGRSNVFDPLGSLVLESARFEESIVAHELDENADGWSYILDESRLDGDFAPRPVFEEEPTWMALRLGLRDHVRKGGRRGAVVMVDGGLASFVLAALATDELGPTNVHLMVDCAARQDAIGQCRKLATDLRVEATMLDTGPELGRLKGVARSGASLALGADLAWRQGSALLLPLDATSLLHGIGGVTVAVGAFAPLADRTLAQIAGLARWRNMLSPVLPRDTLEDWECPGYAEDQTDDVLAAVAHLTVSRSGVERACRRLAGNASPGEPVDREEDADEGGVIAGLGVIGEDGVSLPGIPDDIAKELMDSLSYLRDIAMSGGMPTPNAARGETSPGGRFEVDPLNGISLDDWRGPFSLN